MWISDVKVLGRGDSKGKGPESESCLHCSGKLRRLVEDDVGRVLLGKGKPESLYFIKRL